MMLFAAIGLTTAVYAADPIVIEIDGKVVASDVAPVIENNRTLVPINTISRNLGWDIAWNGVTRQVTVKSSAYTMILTIGSQSYTVNGAAKTMDVPAKIIDGRTMLPINDEIAAMNKNLSIAVAGGGSGAGIKDTDSGANNVGMSSRDLTADELKTLTPVKMANDAIAIIVHPNNPVKNLSVEQAAKIFLGEIKNWKDVGGNNAPILVQTRETGSGTLSTLEEMLLEKQTVVSTATPFTSSALIKQAVAKSENAIGFDSVGFVDSSVKMVSLGGVTPSETTVKNSTYPLSRSLYVITKGPATGVNAMLIDYLKTQGVQQNIVKKEGYITLD